MCLNRFEKICWIAICALSIFLGIAQWDMKKEHDERHLKRQLMYKQFLEGLSSGVVAEGLSSSALVEGGR
jgi:hypothetical protein